MSDIECLVFLPQEKKTFEYVSHVSVATESGDMDIYADHADCFAAITGGDVRIVKSDKTVETIHIQEGGCYFSQNRFVLFVSSQ